MACLDGATSGNLSIVPAVFDEWPADAARCGALQHVCAPQWLRERFRLYIYQRIDPAKECFVPNHTFEVAVYLRFLVDHYHALPKYVMFVQADWFSSKPRKFVLHHRPKIEPSPPAFPVWQLQCAEKQESIYIPLGKHHTIWPPQFLINTRIANWYEGPLGDRARNVWRRAHGDPPQEFVEACMQQLLDDLQLHHTHEQVTVHNYYINQNFIVARRMLQARSHSVYKELYKRVSLGRCLPTSSQQKFCCSKTQRWVSDGANFSKMTGMVYELLSDAIWGNVPAHNASYGIRHNPAAKWAPGWHVNVTSCDV